MAKGIMNDFVLKVPMEIEARGLVVQFPEPVNQKAEAVLISNGISTEGMVSTQLEESDITESTMVFTMEFITARAHYRKLCRYRPGAGLCAFTVCGR